MQKLSFLILFPFFLDLFFPILYNPNRKKHEELIYVKSKLKKRNLKNN